MFTKSTKFLFLPTLLLMFFQNLIFARPGIVIGDGGTIAELRAGTADIATILTMETLQNLEEANFHSIKKHYLVPIAKYANPANISNSFKNAKKTFTTMIVDKELLSTDIWVTVMENGKCSDEATACTTSYKKFSKITIDFEQVVDKYMDVAELIGLLMHEFSHHFAGEADHEEGNMPLGKYFQRYVLKSKNIKGVVFEGEDLIVQNDSHKFLLRRSAGHEFCRRKGYDAISFEESIGKTLDVSTWSYDGIGGRNYLKRSDRHLSFVYTKLVCI